MTAGAPSVTDAPTFAFAGRGFGKAGGWLAAPLSVGVLAVLSFLLISPGRSFVGIYVNDLMVFYDGAHRLLEGQVPNRDFHTPLGPLAYLLPAFGLWAGGNLGSMIPIATAAYAAMLAPALFHVSATRLPLHLMILVVLYIAVLTVAPINPGDVVVQPTFAMFYNRFGWSALSVLFLLALPRIRGGGGRAATALDALCAAWLALMLFYLKLSYAAVGFAFLIGLIVLPRSRRFAVVGLIGLACAMLLVETAWRATGAYLSDALSAAAVSGAVRGGAYQLALQIIANLRQLSVFGAVLAVGVVRKTQPIYLAGSLVMAICGVLLLNQNAQMSEIPVLLPAALLAALAPAAPKPDPAAASYRLITLLLIGALVAPGLFTGLFGLRHFRHELNHAPASASALAEFDGIVTHEGALVPAEPGRPSPAVPADTLAQALRTGKADTSTLNLVRQIRSQQPLAQSEYMQSLFDGVAVLRSDPSLAGPIYTFDLQNPFNAMLDRRPPRGDSSWNHYGRTFNEHIFLPPEKALAGVQVLMDPKDPMELYSNAYQKSNYAHYISKNFRLVRESTYWRVYRRVPGKTLQ